MSDRAEIIEAFADYEPYARDLPAVTIKSGVYLDTLEHLKRQEEIIDALLKVGYPHNFQREAPWIKNYMYAITDVVKKVCHLQRQSVKVMEQE